MFQLQNIVCIRFQDWHNSYKTQTKMSSASISTLSYGLKKKKPHEIKIKEQKHSFRMTIILSIVVQPWGMERKGQSHSKLHSLAIKSNADLYFAIPGNLIGLNFVLLVDLPSSCPFLMAHWLLNLCIYAWQGNVKEWTQTNNTHNYKYIQINLSLL